jgi:predicted permease
VNFNRVSPRYFATMGTPILRGRDFDSRADTATSTPVAIVTDAFARKYFPNADPIGRTFQIDVGPGVPNPPLQIVGVARDMIYQDLREPFGPIAFVPSAQDAHPPESAGVMLRASAPLATITAEVASAVGAIDSSIVIEFRTMERQLHESLLRERLMATLSGFFGVLAALLATIGLYGVMSYMVAKRRNEIGVRLALGADRRDVVRMILREAGVLLASGVFVGLLIAIAAGRAVTTMLFGLAPTDPVTLAMAAAGLGAVAMCASYLPALRASRLEPTEALREE